MVSVSSCGGGGGASVRFKLNVVYHSFKGGKGRQGVEPTLH